VTAPNFLGGLGAGGTDLRDFIISFSALYGPPITPLESLGLVC